MMATAAATAWRAAVAAQGTRHVMARPPAEASVVCGLEEESSGSGGQEGLLMVGADVGDGGCEGMRYVQSAFAPLQLVLAIGRGTYLLGAPLDDGGGGVDEGRLAAISWEMMVAWWWWW